MAGTGCCPDHNMLTFGCTGRILEPRKDDAENMVPSQTRMDNEHPHYTPRFI